MERNYLAFDIEITEEIPEEAQDWKGHRPLGISCAATLKGDDHKPLLWHGVTSDGRPSNRMSKKDAMRLVQYLVDLVADGYSVVTRNGLGFDFDILAEEAGMFEECKHLAFGHVDMMFHLFCELGYPVSLENAAKGMGLAGKLEGMTGRLAPQLWAMGNRQAVLDYVAQDALTTLELAQTCERQGSFYWITRTGNRRAVALPSGWFTVQEALARPEPDTSWMSDPLSRSKFPTG